MEKLYGKTIFIDSLNENNTLKDWDYDKDHPEVNDETYNNFEPFDAKPGEAT